MGKLLFPLLLLSLTSTLALAITGGAVLDWSDGSSVVTIQPLSETVIDGYIVNAFYNGSNQVVLLAEPYYQGQNLQQVTFSVYNFYTHQFLGNYTVQDNYTVITVPSNITVVFISFDAQQFGPFYVTVNGGSYAPPLLEQMLMYTVPLSSVALFGLRAGLRNVGLGLIVSSVFTSAEMVALGVSNPWLYAIPTLEIMFAVILMWHSVQTSG
jgi:hypothetical protein